MQSLFLIYAWWPSKTLPEIGRAIQLLEMTQAELTWYRCLSIPSGMPVYVVSISLSS